MSRGELTWRFAIPDDGRLLVGGMAPYLIQWHTDTHPATHMADLGCRLSKVAIYHPHPDWLSSILRDIGTEALVEVHPLTAGAAPYLAVELKTPKGDKVLDSRL